MCLLLRVIILFLLPITTKNFNSKVSWSLSLSLVLCFLLLTFIGIQGVEPPFILLGQLFTLLYFILLGVYMLL